MLMLLGYGLLREARFEWGGVEVGEGERAVRRGLRMVFCRKSV